MKTLYIAKSEGFNRSSTLNECTCTPHTQTPSNKAAIGINEHSSTPLKEAVLFRKTRVKKTLTTQGS